MTPYYGCQIVAHLGNWIVPTPPQLSFYFPELGPQPICRCMPMHPELSLPGPPTAVDQPKKLESLRFSLPALLPVLRGVPPKFQQARLVRVQRQAKLP